MKKWLHRIFVAVLAVVFVTSGIVLGSFYMRYKNSRDTQNAAVQQFTRPSSAAQQKTGTAAPAPGDAKGEEPSAPDETPAVPDHEPVYAPIEVDFTELRKVNKDIIGWIYCENTVINYPVVYGRDNEYYLERNYLGNPDSSGTIFTDRENRVGFVDANVILYGHHMADKTMFATLNNWLHQEYYEENPVMWILTPEQDYRVELFAGYITSSDSQTYTIIEDSGSELEGYLAWVKKWSEIQSDVETPSDAQYVVLSTCDYSFDEARSVLHGKLVPVDSAGGVPIKTAPASK